MASFIPLRVYAKLTVVALGGALAIVVMDAVLPNPLLTPFDTLVLLLGVVAIMATLAVFIEAYSRLKAQ